MSAHANSQITDNTEILRLQEEILSDPQSIASLTVERACRLGTQEILVRWSMQTPKGGLHRVAIVSALDGEVIEFDEVYRDESDAIAVWEDLADAYAAEQANKAPRYR